MDIKNNDKYILIYGIKGDRLEKLERVAFAHGFGLREIQDFELDLKVRDLLDGNKNEKPEDFIFEDRLGDDFEYMLFVNIKDEQLYKFLDEIKAEGVYIPHKAVLTENNINWPLFYLMNENKEEHKVMTVYGQLRKIMGIGANLQKDIDDPELDTIMQDAQDYFHPREFEFEELQSIYNRLAIKINTILEERR